MIEKVFVKDDWELNIIGWSKKDFSDVYFKNSDIDIKKLSKNKFLGKIDDNDKYDILLKSHIFILLSYKEAQPLTVIEAGIFKCGIILSNIEMLLEFKNFETVFYNKNNLNKKNILQAIKSNQKLFDISNSFIKIYSFENYCKNILNVFKSYN